MTQEQLKVLLESVDFPVLYSFLDKEDVFYGLSGNEGEMFLLINALLSDEETFMYIFGAMILKIFTEEEIMNQFIEIAEKVYGINKFNICMQ